MKTDLVPLRLYSTEACHLCENAKSLLWPALERWGLKLEEIDISESEEMVERYGVRIPVLGFSQYEIELDWPFDELQLEGFFSKYLLES